MNTLRKLTLFVLLALTLGAATPPATEAAPGAGPGVSIFTDNASGCTFTVGSPQYRSDYNRVYYTGTMSCPDNRTQRTLEVRLRRDFSWSPDQTRSTCRNSGVLTFYRCSSSASCGSNFQNERYFTEATDLQTGAHYLSQTNTVPRLCGSAL